MDPRYFPCDVPTDPSCVVSKPDCACLALQPDNPKAYHRLAKALPRDDPEAAFAVCAAVALQASTAVSPAEVAILQCCWLTLQCGGQKQQVVMCREEGCFHRHDDFLSFFLSKTQQKNMNSNLRVTVTLRVNFFYIFRNFCVMSDFRLCFHADSGLLPVHWSFTKKFS